MEKKIRNKIEDLFLLDLVNGQLCTTLDSIIIFKLLFHRDSDDKTQSDSAEQIMTAVRTTLGSYPFNFTDPKRQARIIDGKEEGAFSWVTVNYLNGTFGDVSDFPNC